MNTPEDHDSSPRFETVIGLEIHVQLQTESKLFCGCSTKFGSEPNTQTCPVCIGAPGALPVLNQRAIELSILTGLALNCKIEQETKWDRKNYFYPDNPKGYQISQLEKPVCGPGYLDMVDPMQESPTRRIRIVRAHLEEDAGKSIHDESNQAGSSRIDLNRAGTPLLEIVTRPDIRSGSEARSFLSELKLILADLSVSDCNMQHGNLRVDANVNIHVVQDDIVHHETPIVEIKNLNSFRGVERALNYESARQIEKWKNDGVTIGMAPKQTRGWNDTTGKTIVQREKEEAADYRYFPEPDLAVVQTSKEQIAKIGQSVRALPSAERIRLAKDYGLPRYDANVIVNQGFDMVQYFETTTETVRNGKLVSNWIQQEVLRHLNEQNQTLPDFPIDSARFAELLVLISDSQLDASRGREVFSAMAINNINATEAMSQLDIATIDADEIESICRTIIEDNPKTIIEIQSGNLKAIGPLIGMAKRINSNVNPNDVRRCLFRLIDL